MNIDAIKEDNETKYFGIHFLWDDSKNGGNSAISLKRIIKAKNDEDAIRELKKRFKVSLIYNISQSEVWDYNDQIKADLDYQRWQKVLDEK